MALVVIDSAAPTAESYRRFARLEAAGRSPTYESLALAVAGDHDLLAFLDGLPAGKRQPNLLFAAARRLTGGVPGINDLRALATGRPGELATVMRARSTQTNEPGRCATLLPALALVEGPLAILEVGASAGLCLNLARYSYDYGTQQVRGTDSRAPTLKCEVLGGEPRLVMPDVRWAAGIDLNPLDPADPEDRSWLESLVWPDQPERAARLSGALEVAARHPVPVHAGDLVEQLSTVLDQAPPDATPVVFHSAVLAYLDEEGRSQFADLVRSLGATWLSNEAPGVVVDVDPPSYDTVPFVLAINGEPVAFTHPHGDWIDWLG